MNSFGVGQNFIRKYNMTAKFSEKQDTGKTQISMSIFIGKADNQRNILDPLLWQAITASLLLAYVGWFTVLKFRRVKVEKTDFEKISKGVQCVTAQDARRMLQATQQEEGFIKGDVKAANVN